MRNVLMGFESGMFQAGDFRLRKLGGAKNSQQANHTSVDSDNNATMAPESSKYRRAFR